MLPSLIFLVLLPFQFYFVIIQPHEDQEPALNYSLFQEREKKKAKGSTKGSAKGPPQPTLEDFAQSPERSVPLFLEKCVYFIELEGLDSEGIYRVPGNKVHVEQLTTKFKEGEKLLNI